ncbi:MAG: HAD hydrolase-like protein [Lachnospiraceae bacterium]|nr:HAD hydrolase-like protein [Lachnospiraceae bacterium]MBR3683713.1 HAD hydrolase-like protein [Lachnospiraceae bacterium]
MYQYILFDLDGTLTDPKEGITKSVNHALAAFGKQEEDLSKLEPFIGPPLPDSFKEFYGMNEEEAERAVKVYRERFSEVGWLENEIYPGIKELLQTLYKQGRFLAVASSKPQVFVEKILKHFEIHKYFQVIVGSELDGTRYKKEEVVEEALRQLRNLGSKKGELPKLDETNTAMVGDRKFDIEGAKAYGLSSIAVSYGYAPKGELKEAAPTCIVDSVEDLKRILNSSAQVTRPYPEANLPISVKLWNLVLPMVLYYFTASLFMVLVLGLIESYVVTRDADVLAWWVVHSGQVKVTVNGIGMVIGVFVVKNIYREEKMPAKRVEFQQMVPVILIGICASLGINIVFELLKITESSATYTQTATAQHSVPLWLGILLYGVISSVAEEVVFRGIIYQRLKKYFAVIPAMICSSVLFGAYHGNVVQGIYGSIMGMLIVISYEWCKTLAAPVLLHSVANLAIFLVGRNDALAAKIANPLFAVLFITFAGMCVYYMYCKKRMCR